MPDFLIVGAMKSGTSALAFHLRNHTDICMPRSELHFFDNDKRLARGLGGYLKQLNRGLRAETQIIGEKCPTYSYLPVAAERIHQSYPDVKLVWIFREPVSRAYSNYLHILKSGGLHCGFEEAVHNEAALIEQNRYLGFMERSRYVEQVLRFLRLFKKEQMHFMVFESFVADLENELARLFDFLGVSREGFTYIRKTPGRAVYPRWQTSVWAARQLFGTGILFRVVQYLNLAFKAPGYQRLSPESLLRYKERFVEDNRRLEELTGLDLSAWR